MLKIFVHIKFNISPFSKSYKIYDNESLRLPALGFLEWNDKHVTCGGVLLGGERQVVTPPADVKHCMA